MAELYHLGVSTTDVPRLAVLVDPLLDTSSAVAAIHGRPLATRREYITHLGSWDGQGVLVATVGIGAPPLAIAIEELSRAGTQAVVLLEAATFTHAAASWLLPHGAARHDGTSAQYAPLPFPAVPDPVLRARLARACGAAASSGIVETEDVLDATGTPSGPAAARDLRCAALFVVAAARRVRAAALLVDLATIGTTGGQGGADAVGDMAVAAYRALTTLSSHQDGADMASDAQ